MGWCSGTDIFDRVVKEILNDAPKEVVIRTLIDSLEDHDWDCQNESDYYDVEPVNGIFREKHPIWFEDEED